MEEEEIVYEEEDKDDKRKKRMILFWILFVGTIIAIILVILSITMCRRKIEEDIEVVYDGEGVDALVRVYAMDSDGTLEMVGDEMAFESGVESAPKSVIVPAIVLDSENRFTIFKYDFENRSNNSTGNRQMNLVLDDSEMVIQNMKVTYLVTYDDDLSIEHNLKTINHLYIIDNELNINDLNPETSVSGKVAHVYIKVEIVDSGLNSEYSGELNWILSPVE